MSDRAISLLGVKADNAYDFKKTIQTSSAPSIITKTEATRLIDYMVDESVLWQMVRVERMDRATKWIRFLDITKGVLRRDVCGSYEDSGQITAEGKQLQARKHKVVIPICDDVLKDNLEGPALEEHILRMVAEQINNELEVIALMANLGGHYTNDDVDTSVLHWFDGWYEQMKLGNLINPTYPHCCLDWCHFGWMMRTLATKYRKRPDLLRFFMAPDLGIDYADMLEKRQTGLGDSIITGATIAKWRKTPLEEIPLLPTDLPNVCGAYEDGQAGTFMFLSRPENLVLGIQYEIGYERQRDGVNSQTFHIFRIGFDALIQNVAATVLLDGLTTRTECCVPTSTS